MVLAGVHAGTAANTAVNVINLLVDAHDAEIVEIGLNAVIGTSGHSHFNMVMGWEYQALNLSGQLVCIGIALDAVGVSDKMCIRDRPIPSRGPWTWPPEKPCWTTTS